MRDKVLIPLAMSAITLAEARLLLLRSSPRYFPAKIVPGQVHHGSEDASVAIAQSELLAQTMTALGFKAPQFEYFRYEGGGHNFASLTGSEARETALLQWVHDQTPQ